MERLDPNTSLLFVIDIQERLSAAIPSDVAARVQRNAEVLLEASRLLGVRAMASEQYPKGLGPTVETLRARLEELQAPRFEKLSFGALGEPSIARAVDEAAPRDVVIVGMETHICVFQTVRELVQRGLRAHVVADAVASRTDERRAVGLSLCERAGAIVTTTETVLFDWLGRAGTDEFRAISKLIR
jgi:nicotinamidase-related amidase